MINKFEDKYSFLSNFYPCKVFVFGYEFKSSEAAYQSQKDPSAVTKFVKLTAREAKQLGKKVNIRSDWNDVKDSVMRTVIEAKFNQNANLAQKLLETGDEELIEGNDWRDRYWGKVLNTDTNEWEGENNLGKTLMYMREDLKKTFVPKKIVSPFKKVGVGSVKDVAI